MAIQDELATVIRKARYFPELLPMCHAQDLAAGDNAIISLSTPTVSVDYPILTDKLTATPNANVLLKIKADRESAHEAETIPLDAMGELTPLEFRVTANLSLILNSDAIVPDYKFYLGIWVVKPSVAQKILWGLPLSAAEEALSAKRGVRDSVLKGVLPFPIPYGIERECMGLRQTYTERVATTVTGQTTPIVTLSPLAGEFLVLESISADSGGGLTLANNAQIIVSRDDDRNYLSLPVFAMGKTYDFPCFIPALRKLEIGYYADAVLANRDVRFVVSRYKLTNILRARFGLETTDMALEDIRAGVVP